MSQEKAETGLRVEMLSSIEPNEALLKFPEMPSGDWILQLPRLPVKAIVGGPEFLRLSHDIFDSCGGLHPTGAYVLSVQMGPTECKKPQLYITVTNYDPARGLRNGIIGERAIDRPECPVCGQRIP